MADTKRLYPRTGDKQTVYLKNVIIDPTIIIGDYTIYNDSVNDPVRFGENNVLYHYPTSYDRLTIGKSCSIACGAKLLSSGANYTLSSFSTYPFPLFSEEWRLEKRNVAKSWDDKEDIVLGSDVWIGYEAVIMTGVTIGGGVIIGAWATATEDVSPYAAAGGIPTRSIKKRYPEEAIAALSELKRWDWLESRIAQNLHAIQAG